MVTIIGIGSVTVRDSGKITGVVGVGAGVGVGSRVGRTYGSARYCVLQEIVDGFDCSRCSPPFS